MSTAPNICCEVIRAEKEKSKVYAAVKMPKSNAIRERSGLKQAISPFTDPLDSH